VAADHDSMDDVFRARQKLSERYRLDNPGNKFNFEILRDAIASHVKKIIPEPDQALHIDLGSGDLFWPQQFAAMGLKPEHAIGSDLLLWRLKEGRAIRKTVPALCCSAAQMPFPSNTFHLISQFAMMTSILDESLKKQIADEIMRVLAPGGYILWYDFHVNNPGNPHTRAIGKPEITRLFPGLPLTFTNMTLLPPLARRLSGPLSPLLKILHRLPILRTHYLVLIGPKG